MKKPPRSSRPSPSGVALVISLSILTLVTVLVVGFAVSMRTERQAAASTASDARAKIVAQAALDHAVGLLQRNIPEPLPPGTAPAPRNWSVAPGRLVVTGSSTTSVVSLTSGDANGPSDPDLNQVSPSDGARPILPVATPMRVRWQPLSRDPGQPAGPANPAVGRYAFWVDDENSKVNFNAAYGKPAAPAAYNLDNPGTARAWVDRLGKPHANDEHDSFTFGGQNFQVPMPANGAAATIYRPDNPYSLGHPASVNLDVFPALDRDALWTAGTKRRFPSPEEIKRFVTAGGSPDVFYRANQFWLTHFNADPEFNAFGKSRIFLARDTAFQNGTAGDVTRYGSSGFTYVNEDSGMTVRDATEPLTFHSSLMNYDTAPGGSAASTSASPAADLNGVQVTGNTAATAVARVAQYLNSTAWPGHRGASFAGKWGAREADQVAWNLYGMTALGTVGGQLGGANMHDGSWANTTPRQYQPNLTRFGRFLWDGPLSGARILPQTRTPYISKFGVQLYVTWRRKSSTGDGWVPDPLNPGKPDGIYGTSRYVVSVRVQPEIMLPKNYQGYTDLAGNTAAGWTFGANGRPDRFFVTHFEATFDDGSGTRNRVVRWCSEAPKDDNSLYWDPTGGSGSTPSWPGTGDKSVMPGDNTTFRDVNAGAEACEFSTYDKNQADNRTLDFVFDSGSPNAPQPCTVKNMKLRFVCATCAGGNSQDLVPYQVSPIRDVDGAPGFEPATQVDVGAIVFPQFTLDTRQENLRANTDKTQSSVWVTMETTDPRVNQRGSTPGDVSAPNPPPADDWQPSAGYGTGSGNQDLGRRSTRLSRYPATGPYGDESKCASFDASSLSSGPSLGFSGGYPSETNRRLPSTGWLSCVSTGMQRGHPWSTLQFHRGAAASSPPDWLLMDLFAVPYNAVDFPYGQTAPNPTLPRPLTWLNSTAGKVNLNALIFPQVDGRFSLPQSGPSPTRDAPIRALFKNAWRPNLLNPVQPARVSEDGIFRNLVAYLNAKPNQVLDYAGEICEVPGIADETAGANEWEREALVRGLAGLCTTRSNGFSVWGVAQALNQDVVTGEKRFHAIVERYVWPGVDGTEGNGRTAGSTASYAAASLGSQRWLGSPTNFIDAWDPAQPGFERAFNPGAVRMKYRVVYFRYLD